MPASEEPFIRDTTPKRQVVARGTVYGVSAKVWRESPPQSAYSARSRTPFRSDGGQHCAVMADTVPG